MALRTQRLDLVPATVEAIRADLRGPRDLAAVLGVAIPPAWPPDLIDRSALEAVLERITTHAEPAEWWLHYFVRRASGVEPPVLVGVGGYKGEAHDGAVEIGYSVLPVHRRQGYATEATSGLVLRAFVEPVVDRVIAHTLPELTASIGVLEKCGFRLAGPGIEAGTIRFELSRAIWFRRLTRPDLA